MTLWEKWKKSIIIGAVVWYALVGLACFGPMYRDAYNPNKPDEAGIDAALIAFAGMAVWPLYLSVKFAK